MQPRRSIFACLTRLLLAGVVLCMAGALSARLIGSLMPAALVAFTDLKTDSKSSPYNVTPMRLHLLDVRTGLVLQVSDQPVVCCTVWSPDGTRVAFTGADGQTLIWDRQDSSTRAVGPSHFGFRVADWSPDGNALLSITTSDSLTRLDLLAEQSSHLAEPLPSTQDTAIRDAIWLPDPGGITIVFSAYVDENWEIYRALREGIYGWQVLRLTHVAGDDRGARVSPDGSRIVFISDRDGNHELYAMNVNPLHLKRLSATGHDDDLPVWSPDGARVLFVLWSNGEVELYTTNASQLGLTRLTTTDQDEALPAWSPDGKRLVYAVSDVDSPTFGEIRLMNADGGGDRELMADETTYGLTQLCWLDNVQVIYEYRNVRNGFAHSEFYLLNADSGDRRLLFQSVSNDPTNPICAP